MLMRSCLTFFGPDGQKLEELHLLDAETGLPPAPTQIKEELPEEEPPIVYLGVIQIPVGVGIPLPDGRSMTIDVRPQDVRFQINASSRKEAFEKFEAAAKTTLEELQKRQKEREDKANKTPDLIVPNAAQSEAINKLKLITE